MLSNRHRYYEQSNKVAVTVKIMINRNSPEYLTLIEYNDIITSEIKGDLTSVSQAMQRERIIPTALEEEMTAPGTGFSSRTRAAMLVDHLTEKVQVNTDYFEVFCAILDDHWSTNNIARNLREYCNGLATTGRDS